MCTRLEIIVMLVPLTGLEIIVIATDTLTRMSLHIVSGTKLYVRIRLHVLPFAHVSTSHEG
jgi:hypothetical protein